MSRPEGLAGRTAVVTGAGGGMGLQIARDLQAAGALVVGLDNIVLIFGGVLIGVLVGGIGVWLGGLGQRREAKRLRSRVWALENQLRVQKQQEDKARAERYSAQQRVALPAAGD